MSALRRLVPYTLLPLSLVACVLASAPWLRAFPTDVMAAPLFGAAVLSVLAPIIIVGIGVRPLWLSALLDVALFVFYENLVVLREPGGFGQLYSGLVHGPAQILSFALPLVSPRSLLVAPIALCWLSGTLIGECVARGWQTVVPYLALIVTFGLAYAGTARAVTSADDGRHYDTVFAAVLLIVLLLLRAAQAWVVQDESAESTQPEGLLPLRGLAVGAVLTVAVAPTAAAAVQAPAFTGRPVAPARVPPVDESRPLTPVAFVAGLRPTDPNATGEPLFQMNTDRGTSNYVAIASVDYYDGDSWTFSRTFRPSGGTVPADPDPAMRSPGAAVTQQYEIAAGPMTSVPWMPHIDRPQQVTGVAVNIDAASGMIVPARTLRPGDAYTVTSTAPGRNFDQLGKSALLGTSASQLDTTLPNGLATPLAALVRAFTQETGVSSDAPIPFLQAVARELRTRATLAGQAPATPAASPSPTPSSTSSSTASRSPTSSPAPSSSAAGSATGSSSAHAGGTTFADVLASIRGSRTGTPEQFATLIALVARALDVPARVVSGFRLPATGDSAPLPAGTYTVTSAEAWTWVEIPIRGLGWVVLDASPSKYSGQAPQQTAGATRSPSPSPAPSKNALLTRSNNGGHAAAPPSRTPRSNAISTAALVIVVAAAVLLAGVLLLVLLLARKLVRVRRRHHGDPRRQVVGAWQESLDLLVEAGLPDLSSATTAEVAAATRNRFGGAPADKARAVGTAADVAIFSPASPVEAADAEAAWRTHAALRHEVRRSLSWPDRVAARLRYNRMRRGSAHRGAVSWADDMKRRAGAAHGKHTGRARRRLDRR